MAHQLLKGRKGLIFGALNDKSIAWKVAELAVAEGAEIVLTNTPVSIRLGEINRLAEQCGTIVIPADATSVADLEALVDGTMEHFGGKFDFVLHAVAMSPRDCVFRPFPYARTHATSNRTELNDQFPTRNRP
jgi:enoyl-[acyl-carrier protein] reductase I